MNLGAFLAGFGPGILDAQTKLAQQRAEDQRLQLLGLEARSRLRQMQDEGDTVKGFNSAMGDLQGGGDGPTAPPVPNISGQAPQYPGTGDPNLSAGGALVGDHDAALVRKFESEGLANRLGISPYAIGVGGTDLSNAPHDQYGFPQWAGRGNSHAAGAYQFQPGTWGRYAAPLGVHDFSPASQDRVFQAAHQAEGWNPWAPYNPKIAAATRSGEGGAAPPAQLARAGPTTMTDATSPANAAPAAAGGDYVEMRDRGGTYRVPRKQYEQLEAGGYHHPGVPTAGAPKAAGPDPADADARRVAQVTAPTIDPSLAGKMSPEGIARSIEKAIPNASPKAKHDAIMEMSKFLSPWMRQQWEERRDQTQRQQHLEDEANRRREHLDDQAHGDRQHLADQEHGDSETRAAETRREAISGRERQAAAGMDFQPYVDTDGTRYRFNPKTGEARAFTGNQPYEPKGGGVPVGAAAARGPTKPENVISYNADGKMVYEGTAAYVPGTGWVNPQTQAPIPGERIEMTGKGAAGGAGRSGQQITRQLTSAREIMSDLQNIVNLPVTTTGGIFRGRGQGPGLMDALKENFAETLTSEDAELANSALSGIERELSIVVSPVYGGKWAAETFNKLSLKEGQTALVKVYNLARMRQTVDNALETIQNTDWVGREQKEYAQRMREAMDKAVPWTPNDVIDFRRRGDNRTTFGDFIKQQGVGRPQGGQQQGASGQPQAGQQQQQRYDVGEIIERGGKRYRVIGGDPHDPELKEVP